MRIRTCGQMIMGVETTSRRFGRLLLHESWRRARAVYVLAPVLECANSLAFSGQTAPTFVGLLRRYLLREALCCLIGASFFLPCLHCAKHGAQRVFLRLAKNMLIFWSFANAYVMFYYLPECWC